MVLLSVDKEEGSHFGEEFQGNWVDSLSPPPLYGSSNPLKMRRKFLADLKVLLMIKSSRKHCEIFPRKMTFNDRGILSASINASSEKVAQQY